MLVARLASPLLHSVTGWLAAGMLAGLLAGANWLLGWLAAGRLDASYLAGLLTGCWLARWASCLGVSRLILRRDFAFALFALARFC